MKVDIYTLVHEIKNPLAICKGYLSMLNSNNLERYKDIISCNLQESLNILNNYLDTRKMCIQKDIMDINLLMESIIDNYKNICHVNFKYISLYDELLINGDYDRLKQVFNNIIKNSIEASSKNISISVKIVKNDVLISILDDGSGINDLLKVNNGSSYTNKINGNGIGIIVCREIIKAHGGSIKYDNNIDTGCRVIIKLPINI